MKKLNILKYLLYLIVVPNSDAGWLLSTEIELIVLLDLVNNPPGNVVTILAISLFIESSISVNTTAYLYSLIL